MPPSSSSRPIEILLIDDSPTDVLLTREAMEYSRLLNVLHCVENGVEGLAFLRREGAYADKPRPHLILLDLNLPIKGGLDVLVEIKADPSLRTIPVVILTTSKTEEDVMRSYGMHANCFITKPVDFEQFTRVVQSINEFWFSIVTLPPPTP